MLSTLTGKTTKLNVAMALLTAVCAVYEAVHSVNEYKKTQKENEK